MTLRNNIIWGNTATTGEQIGLSSGYADVSYSDVQGGWAGPGNINAKPLFNDTSYYLLTVSPCVDAGNPDTSYNDPQDSLHPGSARFPSRGSLRNDMGAHGGRGALPTVYINLHQNDPRPPPRQPGRQDGRPNVPAVMSVHDVRLAAPDQAGASQDKPQLQRTLGWSCQQGDSQLVRVP